MPYVDSTEYKKCRRLQKCSNFRFAILTGKLEFNHQDLMSRGNSQIKKDK